MRVARTIANETIVTTAAFTSDSRSLIVGSSLQIAIYNVADGVLKKIIPLDGSGGRSYRGELGSDGRFWFGTKNRVHAIDLDAGTVESFDYPATTLEVFNDRVYVLNEGSTDVTRLDMAGQEADTPNTDAFPDFFESIYGHWLGHSPF
jgi:hypothetical protein